MKLPPLALSAPTLCPRCDTPAAFSEICMQCSLQLRQCGNCHGVAGPFDRHCGFCGFELLRGSRRSPVWRLWLLLALVPLAAGLGYGAWVARLPSTATQAVGAAIHPSPTPQLRAYQSQRLHLAYAIPGDWSAIDYTRSSDAGSSMPLVVVTRTPADQQAASDAKGDLTAARPQATTLTFGRPSFDTSLVADPTAPAAVLTSEVAPLAANPPEGVKVEVVRPVRATTVEGQPAATVILKLTSDRGTYYLERALVYSPSGKATPMIRVDALLPAASWQSGDTGSVDAIVRTVRAS